MGCISVGMFEDNGRKERLNKGKERLEEFDCVKKVEKDDMDISFLQCRVWPAEEYGYSLHDLYMTLDGYRNESEDYWYTMSMECDDFWYLTIHTTK